MTSTSFITGNTKFNDSTKPNAGSFQDFSFEEIDAKCDEYFAHLDEIADIYNTCSAKHGIGVTLSVDRAKADIMNGNFEPVSSFFDDSGYGGRLHREQLMTVMDVMVKLIQNPDQCGLILGALQSGKTGTSNGLQLFGPTYYLLTGVKVFPMYLLTSLTSHEDQTTKELERFLKFYGNLEFLYNGTGCTLLSYRDGATADDALSDHPVLPTAPVVDPRFRRWPTLKTYRVETLANAGTTEYQRLRVEDVVRRRVHGKALKELREFVARMKARGYEPLFILDESQHGASDRTVTDKATGAKRKVPCVLKRLLTELQTGLGKKVRWICLSATPFDTSDMSRIWKVKQYLPASYRGFNMFKGEAIDDSAAITPPTVVNMTEAAQQFGVPFLSMTVMSFYNGYMKHRSGGRTFNFNTFVKWANQVGYPITNQPFSRQLSQYCVQVERAICDTIHSVATNFALSKNGKPVGMCVRLANDNHTTEYILGTMQIDPTKVEVIRFYDTLGKSGSVKTFLNENRKHKHLPFVIVVTNKARMGDAFPAEVEYFFDFSQKAGDMNGLLQGLLGRACGIGKNSTVILSEQNTDTVRDYIRTTGKLRSKASPHTVMVGDSRRTVQSSILKLYDQSGDPEIQKFIDWVNSEIVGKYLDHTSATKVKRVRKDTTVPVFKYINKHKLFDYIEQNQHTIYPDIVTDLKVARAKDTIIKTDRAGNPVKLNYVFRDNNPKTGEIMFTFRQGDKIGGIGSRGQGQRDSRTDRARAAKRLETQINVTYDPALGRWVATMVTFPLLGEVTHAGPALSRGLPNSDHALNDELNGCERLERDFYEAA